jgi:hypothetical protein
MSRTKNESWVSASQLGPGKPLTFFYSVVKAIWLFKERFSTLFSSQQIEENIFKELTDDV